MPGSTVSNCLRDGSNAAFYCHWVAMPLAASPRTAALACASPNRLKEKPMSSVDEAGTSGQPAVSSPDQSVSIPGDALIIVAVRNTVLFPGMVAPITLGRPKAIAAAQQAVREQRQIGLLLQRDPELSEPGPDDLYRVGTVANIIRYITGPDDSHHVICQGVQRIRVLDFLPGTPFPAARVLNIPEPTTSSPEIEARFLNLQRQAIEATELLPQPPQELIAILQGT